MLDVSYPVAFGAGIVSFFAPCVIPLLPAYVSYVTGVSLSELEDKGYSLFRKKLFFSSLLYIIGFSIVFVLLGTTAASIGYALRRYELVIQRVGGLIIFILGLQFSGFLNISFLIRERKLDLPNWVNKLGYLRSFFIGLIFATAWTPCVGVVLGSILALAAVSGTVFEGSLLLFVYSLGISIPFLIVSLTLASAPKYLNFINKHIRIISVISGSILAVLGLMLLTNTYKFLNSWLFEVASRLGYEIR
jgi:cytochrome c-type biogenesis protein